VNSPTPPSQPLDVLHLFQQAADAVGVVLDRTTDWGASGVRDGQYAVDLEADRACLDVLYGAGFHVLSEESEVTRPDGSIVDGDEDGPVVIVDPLDGSTNASHGIPWFATALCLVVDGAPQVGMVANHATGDVFTAVRGSGARRNGETCAPTGVTQLSNAIVGVSGLPDHDYGWAQFRAMGAAAPDICQVACGVTDAWCDIHDQHGVWDYLASVLIAEEAGCAVGEIADRELCVIDHTARRGPAVAATPELLAGLLAQRRSS
jgi:fructose-1,6-bisphosphatase/inositol monophosphatase family enzyme